MPIMCDDCKCSNWICNTCGESNHNDCGCPCCGCKCQTKEDEKWCDDCGKNVPYTSEGCACQDSTSLDVHIYKSDTNQPTKGSTMTEPITMSEIDLLNIELANVRSTSDSLRDSLNRSRNNVRDIFTFINDYIEENDLDVDDDMPLSELNNLLSNAFGSELVFDKEYEVQVQYTTLATFTIRAKNEQEACEEAEQMGYVEPQFDQDTDDVVTEFDRIAYSQRKGQ